MSHHLGIGLSLEMVVCGLQVTLEREVVLNDAVVNHHNAARAVAMWMRILLGRAPMCCPSRVPQTILALNRLQTKGLLEVTKLSLGPANLHLPMVVDYSYARRIVPSILEPSQPFDDHRDHLLASDV